MTLANSLIIESKSKVMIFLKSSLKIQKAARFRTAFYIL
jgi:hypothetical protein